MKYDTIIRGTFLSRPNRFIARVLVNGAEETVHVKNTGRCRELLIPGCAVILAASGNPARKTKYDLTAVWKEREGQPPLLINIDSQIPNDAAQEFLRKACPHAVIRHEVTHGDSRFDFYLEERDRRAFLEVKGVTLEENGTARFPDAPTERGVKHLRHLISCRKEGYEAYLLFVIQMKEIAEFRPNDAMHREFGDTLREAAEAGVNIIAMDCTVTEDAITIDAPVKVIL